MLDRKAQRRRHSPSSPKLRVQTPHPYGVSNCVKEHGLGKLIFEQLHQALDVEECHINITTLSGLQSVALAEPVSVTQAAVTVTLALGYQLPQLGNPTNQLPTPSVRLPNRPAHPTDLLPNYYQAPQ